MDLLPLATEARIAVDASLVHRYIYGLAEHGRVGESGVTRLVYAPEWRAACAQYAEWCEDAGLSVRHDAVGNVWGRLEGREPGKVIVSGSHIDSQAPGGRYDGAAGALAALIALRVLREQFGAPQRSLECVALCEEESSRFPSANFWGSRAITGCIGADDPESTIGFQGETIASAMREAGFDPARIPEARRDDIAAFLELHIEQGPILEHEGYSAAVVDAITGMRHYRVRLRGQQNHAGAFPMDLRRDPMAGFAEIASGLIATAHRLGRPAVTTIGRVIARPNYPAIVPDEVEFMIDVRHPDPQAGQRLYALHEQLMREVADRHGLEIDWTIEVEHAAVTSSPGLVSVLNDAAKSQGIAVRTMHSGAGHDSQQMAHIAPVAMIFVRSKDGRSHTPEEYSSIEDLVDGIRILAAALYRLAY